MSQLCQQAILLVLSRVPPKAGCLRRTGQAPSMSPGPRQPFKWVKPEVYPLFAAVALGCACSVVIMSHSLFGVRRPGVHETLKHDSCLQPSRWAAQPPSSPCCTRCLV